MKPVKNSPVLDIPEGISECRPCNPRHLRRKPSSKTIIQLTTLLIVSTLLVVLAINRMISPFHKGCQEKIFQKVANLMNIKINPALLPPKIFRGEEITNEYNNSVWGFDVGDKRSSIFDYKNNVIILANNAKRHNLAHEYVHYFQHTYLGYIIGTGYESEWEAIAIQDQFR